MEKHSGGLWPTWEGNKLFFVLVAVLVVYSIVLVFAKIEKTFVEVRSIGFADYTAPTISVTGEGTASAVPDIATVDMTIMNRASTGVAAQRANTEMTNALLAAMRSQGVAEKDLKTSSYQLSPVYDYDVSPAVVSGYEASQTVTVTIRDTAKSGEILAAAGDVGVTQIGSLRMEVDDETDVKNAARVAAITNARAEAEEIAAAMGAHLGRVVSYSESSGGEYYPYYARAEMMESDMKSAPPEIAEGENETQMTVSMVFAIE